MVSRMAEAINSMKTKEVITLLDENIEKTTGLSKSNENILSLEGGGVKGLCHIIKICMIAKILNKDPCEIFTMGGTSVGGLISIFFNIPDPENPGKPLFSPEQIEDIFTKVAHEVFPEELTFRKVWSLNGLLSNKFSAEPLVKLLKEYCKDYTLKDLVGDVVITGYDQSNPQNPIIAFSTLEARKSEDNNYYLSDIVQGITAAPKVLPSKTLSNVTNTKSHVIIDGGMYANDPTLVTWKVLKDNNQDINNIFYLSLKEEDNDEYTTICCGGGIIELLKNNIHEKILHATQLNDELIAQEFFKNKLIELPTYIPKEHADMTNSNSKNLETLKELAIESITESSNYKNLDYNENFKMMIDKIITDYNTTHPDNKLNVNSVYYKELFHTDPPNEDAKTEATSEPIEKNFNEENIEYEKEELLTGIKKFLNEFSEKNLELKEDIEQFLHKAENYTLEEIKGCIISFEQASLKWQEEQKEKDLITSCSMEALKEDMSLEGEEHTDDVPGYNEIMA